MMTELPSGAERRRHPRFPLRGTAQLLIDDRLPVDVRTLDISMGGMGIVTSVNLDVATACTIKVGIPVKPRGYSAIEVQSRITHCVLSSREDGFVIGLQFTRLTRDAASAILAFVRP